MKNELPTLNKKFQQLRRDLIIGVVALFSICVIGILGYKLIEGWNWLDSLYMTIITLSTVGFKEIHPLDEKGIIFTIILIVSGIITVGYMVNRFSDAAIQGYFKEIIRLRQQRKVIKELNHHYILCGFGRTGKQVAIEFAAEEIPFIVIDRDGEHMQQAEQEGYTTYVGDATLDETLVRAGIERAICLVSTLPSDAENLYAILSAKTLNPKVRTVARASSEEAIKKLRRGGADEVISPYITGGKRMAAAALRPEVLDFVDGVISGTNRSFYIEEYGVDAKICPFVGKTLAETRIRSHTGALVVAIRRNDDDNLIPGPSGDTVLHDGDRLICMGTAEQLRHLNQFLSTHPIERDIRTPRTQDEELR